MIIIINKSLPAKAREKLQEFYLQRSVKAEFLVFETRGIVHPAWAGHPDIFFCKTPALLVVSPAVPSQFTNALTIHHIPFRTGTRSSGLRHPGEVYYTAAVSEQYLVHCLKFTDPVILENCHYLKKIDVRQGYTSCSLLLLKEGHYLTSDPGIHKTLGENGLKGIFIPPEGILLPGFTNGLIGGTMGIYQESVFITGSLDHFKGGGIIRNFLQELDYHLFELSEERLTDYGGILFAENYES